LLINSPRAGTLFFQEHSDSVIRTHSTGKRADKLAECVMPIRIDRLHPAVKHGAYSATAVLPGESRAEFEKLHRDLIAEFAPSGVLEDDIVMTIARYVWRKQNLMTLHIAKLAESRRDAIRSEKVDSEFPTLALYPPAGNTPKSRAAEGQAGKSSVKHTN
jgi:hypothetical protein